MQYKKFKSEKYPKAGKFIDDINYHFVRFCTYTLYHWKRDFKHWVSTMIFKMSGKCIRDTWWCGISEWEVIYQRQDSSQWQMKNRNMQYLQRCTEKCNLCKRERNTSHYK